MKFDLVRLLGSATALSELRARSKGLSLWITYLGADLNRHGGDWEELDREAMPTRLVANGEPVHDFIDPPATTKTHHFVVPASAITSAPVLELAFEPKFPEKVTFVYVPIPVAELWITKQE
jgi:hypothetical protein